MARFSPEGNTDVKAISIICVPVAAALYFGLAILVGGFSIPAIVGAVVFGLLVGAVVWFISSAVRMAKNDQ